MLRQRCFILFLALLFLLVSMPFLADTASGTWIIVLANAFVLVTAVAAVARTRFSLVIAILLASPALVLRFLAEGLPSPGQFALAWGCNAAFYVFVLANLLNYVLRRDVMTGDKLYGAVSAYVLIAILWAFLHGVVQYFHPDAYAVAGTPKALDMGELIYFSFTALTTAGFGDITPMVIQSRFLTMLEMVTGVMYIAILIARLTGVYPVVTKT
ncbi:MAG: potassium channel family protein [Nitrospiraceae bacterium]